MTSCSKAQTSSTGEAQREQCGEPRCLLTFEEVIPGSLTLQVVGTVRVLGLGFCCGRGDSRAGPL